MGMMQDEVFNAFQSIGIREEQALKAATTLNENNRTVTALKSDMIIMEWMMVCLLASQIAVFVQLFIHVS